ncbi:light-inducible protein CPRF3 isoform X2 [Amborella trichopoda]|uniref:light-inducible protein CPRF3 isoform X2 n=1 Tax=Amborella trichopoda TaxID=13333 RepID=UPI0005D376C0|nr:light-inducible protein CPRF3 isoform X2 [Amborella trichopoda]XP_020530216.1 light-inducible protein CPRF3 isoform X2 [Amborella trichopoda]|eukprot:XP_011627689.1 light-inducible protein CPRF3 isoform X2 [Amborella trichopoda]
MGSGEEVTPVKSSKAATSNQELPSTPSYPDWATMQAYYGAGSTPPQAFFASTVASSPTPLPYMWGQHLMPPYGTPLPYPPMYPPGGMYPHPPMTPGTVASAAESERRALEGKERGPMKRSKGSSGNLGLVSGKSRDGGKATSGSANDGSQSGESGSEDSSNGSDENNSQIDMQAARKRSFDQMLVEGAQQNHGAQYGESYPNARGQPASNIPGSMTGKSGVTAPTTNLNIGMGMDLWNASPSGTVPMKPRPNAPGTSSAMISSTMVGRDGVPSDLWIQDERELKRQRRKQSNRESARRSRLRKQAECEELASKVEQLNNENMTLKNDLQRLADECEKLTSENASLMDQLTKIYGPDALASIQSIDMNPVGFKATNAESNGHLHDALRGNNSISNGKLGSNSN